MACCRRAPCTRASRRAHPLEPLSLEAACTPLDGRTVLVLDGVTDPQNVGAAFRSAVAFGARAVILQDRKSPPLTGVLAKAAAGAIELAPHVRVANLGRALETLRSYGYLTVALEGEAEFSLEDAFADKRPVALALGAARQRPAPGRRRSLREARAHPDRADHGKLERIGGRGDCALRGPP